MANQTITQLPDAGPITGTELVPVVQNGGTVKTTAAALAGSPVQTQTFLTKNNEPTLNNSRYLSAGTGVGLTDGGAQSFYRISLNGISGTLETMGNGFGVNVSGTMTARSIAYSGSGVTVSNGNGQLGNPTIALDGVVASLANNGGTGFVALPGNGTVAGRTLAGTADQIDITNPNGISGSPVFSIADNPVLPGTGGVVVPGGTTAERPASPNNGLIRYNTQSQTLEGYAGNTWGSISIGSGVSSVGLVMPPQFTVSNSPITSSGDLTASWASQTANYVLAAPNGSAGTPIFRAFANADLPDSGVTANTYGSTTQIPVITVNAKGVITSASTVSFTGGLSYRGGWNASTNTPTLTSSTGVNGYYYIVTTAGSTNLDGITDWQIGDWAIFNGTIWQKIDQTNLVSSVNGQVGVVVLSAADVGAQPADAQLTDIAGLTPSDGAFIVGDGTNFIAESGSTARSSMGAAASGANGDITSMTGVTGGISSPDFIQFDTTAGATDATGKLHYNNADMYQTLTFQMNGGVVQHIGEEMFYRVKLSAAASKGQVLMFTGTLGASGGLTAAPATGLTADQANYLLGVAMESGATNAWIFVASFGEVKGVNTTGGAESWVQGQVLYYNPAVTGGLTKTKPNTPNAIAVMAAVVHVGASNGILFVRPTFGSVLGGTDGNVQFGTLNNGDVIVYDSTDQRWENVAQSTLTAGAVANSVTFNNSGGAAAGATFDGSAARTIDYATVGAPKADGTGASGTWSISISGNAATATSATTATTATTATNVDTTATSTNTNFYIPFVASSSSGSQALGVDAGFSYNPSTNAITAGISGGTF